ncbi:MAG: HAMP domain-containing histidine kinase [Solirubrobacteraceae bacterium]|nr:HAMP domain-containing histidine kinase [Solirubrobacteraceae bacterium]
MRRRLLVSTSLIALAAVVLLGVPLAIVGTALIHQRADMVLERRADAIALRVARAQARGDDIAAVPVADLIPRNSAVQVSGAGEAITLGRVPSGRVTRETSGDGGPLRVTLVAPASARDDDVGALWLTVFGAGFGAVIAAALLASFQARRLAAPLEQLAGRVERVGESGYDGTLVAAHLPEIDQLQRALNGADRRIAELVERERQFTANASHQMRSPLTALRMRLEELQALAGTPEAQRESEAAMTQVDRLITTIEHLEVVARNRDDLPSAVDVGELVRSHVAAHGWVQAYAAAERQLAVFSADGLMVAIAPESVRQIVDVLLDNALRHGNGSVRVQISGPDDGWVRLSVGDDGPRPRDGSVIFQRGVGRGSGIGLAVARDLVLRAGGELRLGTSRTTVFEALLPAVRPRAVLPDLGAARAGRSPA